MAGYIYICSCINAIVKNDMRKYFDLDWNSSTDVSEAGPGPGTHVLLLSPVWGKNLLRMKKQSENEGALYNMQDCKLRDFRFSGAEHRLEVSGLPSEIYTVYVSSDTANTRAGLPSNDGFCNPLVTLESAVFPEKERRHKLKKSVYYKIRKVDYN